MKKLFYISLVFVVLQSTLSAQQSKSKGLSEEGYKHWIRAVTMLEEVKEDVDYIEPLIEFQLVTQTDSTYADAWHNIAVLSVKLGELGGGVPLYDMAEFAYKKYQSLHPSEKNNITKQLIQVDLKKEKFLSNFMSDFKFVEKGVYEEKKGKKIIETKEVDAFYIQSRLFTLADLEKICTPVAMALYGDFSISYYNGEDSRPCIISYTDAEKVAKLLTFITGKEFFIPTLAHYKRIYQVNASLISRTTTEMGYPYTLGQYYNHLIYVWVNHSKGNENLTFFHFPFWEKSKYMIYRNVGIKIGYDSDGGANLLAFRLALSVSEK